MAQHTAETTTLLRTWWRNHSDNGGRRLRPKVGNGVKVVNFGLDKLALARCGRRRDRHGRGSILERRHTLLEGCQRCKGYQNTSHEDKPYDLTHQLSSSRLLASLFRAPS